MYTKGCKAGTGSCFQILHLEHIKVTWNYGLALQYYAKENRNDSQAALVLFL